jgi:hypothetical protein
MHQHHRHSTQDSEAKAAARFALQQAYDWRDESEIESRDMDELLREFETGVRYPACPTPQSAAVTVS